MSSTSFSPPKRTLLPSFHTPLISFLLTHSNGVTLLVNNVEKSDQAIATACFYVFTQLGSAVGTSVAGTIIQNVLRTRLNDLSVSGDVSGAVDAISNARDSLDFVKQLPPELQVVVRGIYASAIMFSFVYSMGDFVLAFLCTTGIKEKAL